MGVVLLLGNGVVVGKKKLCLCFFEGRLSSPKMVCEEGRFEKGLSGPVGGFVGRGLGGGSPVQLSARMLPF